MGLWGLPAFADPARRIEIAPGPQCSAAAAPRGAELAALAARVASRRRPEAPQVQALNGRGHNADPGPRSALELEQVWAEFGRR